MSLKGRKMYHEAERLRLIAAGKLKESRDCEVRFAVGNIAQMTKLLPRFKERDPDVFF